MNNNTTAATSDITNPAIIDVKDKKACRSISWSDLVADAIARGDKAAGAFLKTWRTQNKKEVSMSDAAFTKMRYEYLVKFCGMEKSTAHKNQEADDSLDAFLAE